MFNETASIPKLEYTNDFINFIKDKNTVKHLPKNNIFAMAMKEDTMVLLSPESVQD